MGKKAKVTKASGLYRSEMIVSHERGLLLLMINDEITAVIKSDPLMLYFDKKQYALIHPLMMEVEFRTCATDMTSSFRLYNIIRDCLPELKVKKGRYKYELYEFFTHTANEAIRLGGFRMVTDYHQMDDLFDKAADLLEMSKDNIQCITHGYGAINLFDDDSDEDEFEFGHGTHIGGGVYCDDEGDNWEFI